MISVSTTLRRTANSHLARGFRAPTPYTSPAIQPFSKMAEKPTARRRMNNPAIFVCDLQEKFRNAIYEFDKVVLTTQKVLRAAQALNIPIYTTTQNRARLGETVPELQQYLDSPLCKTHADKTLFSMFIPSVTEKLGTAPAEIVLVGIESHICITQTALDARAAGHKVYVLADGVSSCNKEEVPIALARLRAEGVVVTTSESWLYEFVGDAGIPEFKSIIGIVKDTSADTKKVLQTLSPVQGASKI
ncbi:hypothetical protein J7T55_007884 [Diaporthe amygdali]|uniref:uncharacterized protein n=1 Tax=Phomopsis amygdali TaxID=1214568 RepID=UPI0022FDFA5B|nr:uncharacterized protein J7T55_007884 [Diaporthe amygdali]KAJ0114050.1 hypothetical protein J7T55_007884 [Diaporthe amygdali]